MKKTIEKVAGCAIFILIAITFLLVIGSIYGILISSMINMFDAKKIIEFVLLVFVVISYSSVLTILALMFFDRS